MPLVTQGTRGDQHPSLPAVTGNTNSSLTMRRSTTLSKTVQGDTNTPYVAQVYPGRYQHSLGRTSLPREIPTLLRSHKSTPGDTNTPVNTAERLTLIQRQPYRLYRTYRLFSFRLTLHTEESLSGSNELLTSCKLSKLASYTALYVTLKHRCQRSLMSIPNK